MQRRDKRALGLNSAGSSDLSPGGGTQESTTSRRSTVQLDGRMSPPRQPSLPPSPLQEITEESKTEPNSDSESLQKPLNQFSLLFHKQPKLTPKALN